MGSARQMKAPFHTRRGLQTCVRSWHVCLRLNTCIAELSYKLYHTSHAWKCQATQSAPILMPAGLVQESLLPWLCSVLYYDASLTPLLSCCFS